MNEKKGPKKKNSSELEQELGELTQLLKRVQADFENYRKRSQREREDFAKYLNSDLLLRIIPVVDNFRLAFNHIPENLQSDEWVHGIFHIRKQLEQVFTEEGLIEVGAVGEKFNPAIHEAIEEVESKAPEGEITEVVLSGYKMGDKIVRSAKVRVSKGSKHGLRASKGEAEC